jgi:hypothetical protein
MDAERKAQLDALPWWTWDPHDEAWSTKFDELLAYHAEHGRLPPQTTPGGLGTWVSAQRACRASMDAERKARLDALEWWAWSVRATPVRIGWDARLDELVAYHEEHGRLPPFAAPGIGTWVDSQRQGRATMGAERKARLEALEWWVWDALDDAWSTKFDELVAYHAEHGRLPPQSTGAIGSWVATQRTVRETMSVERKARLEALGWWTWSVRAAHIRRGWDARYDELVAYHAEHGRLPPQSTPGGLGTWVGSQRHGRATISAERKARLDVIPWWVWDVRGPRSSTIS